MTNLTCAWWLCELFVLLGSQSEDASEGRGFLDNVNIFNLFSSKPKQNKPKPRRPSFNYHPPSYHPPSYQPPSYQPPSYQPQSYEPPPYQPPPSTTEGPVEVIIKGQHVYQHPSLLNKHTVRSCANIYPFNCQELLFLNFNFNRHTVAWGVLHTA